MVWSIAESWPGVASCRVVLSDGGLLAQRARRRRVAYDEILVRQARTSMLRGVLGHVFLDLCRVSDSEVAAVVESTLW